MISGAVEGGGRRHLRPGLQHLGGVLKGELVGAPKELRVLGALVTAVEQLMTATNPEPQQRCCVLHRWSPAGPDLLQLPNHVFNRLQQRVDRLLQKVLMIYHSHYRKSSPERPQ